MHADKAVFEGNPFLGIFARASGKLAFVPVNAPERFEAKCRAVLKVDVARVTVADSNLIGIFGAFNSRGAALSCLASESEVRRLKGLGLNVSRLRGRTTAVGSNVLANDRAALVNPAMSAADARAVGDALGVEVVKGTVAGYPTVGCAGIVTGKGLLVHGATGDEELAELETLFRVKGAQGTANMGVPFVGLSIVANSSGYLAGEKTSGFELSRVDEALGFV
ncbi:MAG: translation initiation factor IF-6 [Candidatus ainarchaeum sp.]|nr:translation initiation factor IF-6 [Candidatus ainarchaeum sp.]